VQQLPTPPSDEAGTRSVLAAQLRVAEYTSVRTEWLESRNAQQQTLQWTLAALAVLLAGVVSSNARTAQPYLYIALAGVAVAIATFSQAIWFGEVMRMERAAMYLRGLEQALSRALPVEGDFPPLMWERWRGYYKEVPEPTPQQREAGEKPTPPLWVGKAVPLILAAFALYGLLAVAGVAVLVVAALEPHTSSGHRTAAIATASVAGVLYLAVTAYIAAEAWDIKRGSDKPVDLEKFAAEAAEIEEPTNTSVRPTSRVSPPPAPT
jgi:hypothetical protein